MLSFFFLAFLNLALGFVSAVFLKRWLDLGPVDARTDSDAEETDGEDPEDESPLEEEIESDIDSTPGPESIPESWTETLYEQSIAAETLLEAAIHFLRIRVKGFSEEIFELSITQASLKTEEQAYEANEFQKCLVDAAKKWSECVDATRGVMDQHFGKFGRLSDIQVLLDTGLNSHQLEIRGPTESADKVSYSSDFDQARSSIAGALRSIISSASAFYDYLDAVFAQLIALEERFDDVDMGLLVDTDTSLLNRCGIEKAVFDLREQTTSVAAAVFFAIDDFANLSYFEDVFIGDRIIKCISRILDSNIRKNRGFDRFARLSHGRLLLLLGDTDGTTACNPAERLRKTISQSNFIYGRSEMQISISCAVGEFEEDESLDELVSRLENVLGHAQDPSEGAHQPDTTWSLIESELKQVTPNDDPVRKLDAEIDVRQAPLVDAKI